MQLTVVDAFTDRPFAGNPAAIAMVDVFPSDQRMQDIAREMNLAETAFVVARPDGEHDLRWFTPAFEVDLCGHATLASAHVLGGTAAFHARSGRLACRRQDDGSIEMDFPAGPPVERPLPHLPPGLATPVWSGFGLGYWFAELPTAADVIEHRPDFSAIAALGHALVITATAEPGRDVDIVSRMFAPLAGIPEDPVTGSAHCVLAPYWASNLGRTELVGYQASPRGGTVRMRLGGDRVVLGGDAVTVSRVELLV